MAKEIVQSHLPPPPDDAPTCGPGPFSMADPETVTAILTSAGYCDIGFEQTDANVCVGATVDDVMAFQLKLGPAAEIFRDAPEEAAAKRDVDRGRAASRDRALRAPRRRLDGHEHLGRVGAARPVALASDPQAWLITGSGSG